ncbi:MAG: hypothetical protein AMXMBFR61_17700 [Fimbriimonadales bacterium]
MHEAATCGACRACEPLDLLRFGLDTVAYDHVIALAGNPNTGKSTLFNALTGLRQHVGNWPGKTVVRAEGAYRYRGAKYKVVDLPGTYSLLSNSVDEEVARDFILFGRPNVTVVVTDATCLERNLNLVLQVLEITDRAVVALNLVDEAERQGIRVDVSVLSEELGVPVVPTAARYRRGLPELLQATHEVATGVARLSPKRLHYTDDRLEAAIAEVEQEVLRLFPGLPNARWVALRLLEGDESVLQEVRNGTLGRLTHSTAPQNRTELRVL